MVEVYRYRMHYAKDHERASGTLEKPRQRNPGVILTAVITLDLRPCRKGHERETAESKRAESEGQ